MELAAQARCPSTAGVCSEHPTARDGGGLLAASEQSSPQGNQLSLLQETVILETSVSVRLCKKRIVLGQEGPRAEVPLLGEFGKPAEGRPSASLSPWGAGCPARPVPGLPVPAPQLPWQGPAPAEAPFADRYELDLPTQPVAVT